MTRKSKRPRKRQPQRPAIDHDDAKKPVHSIDPSSPFARAMAAQQERARLFGEKFGLKEAQEQVKLTGNKLGLALFAETIRLMNAETAEPTPQEPQRRKPRKQGGGNKPKLAEKQIDRGKETYLNMLKENSTWAENKTASALEVIERLKLDVSVSTVIRWIVDPVLKER